MDLSHFSFLTFLGAIAIFIYGIRLVRAGIQLLVGDRLRVIISRLTENRLLAMGIGALVTLILQSSNATTITLVGFVASGTMTLTQAMGIMLGADVGTTFVVVLFAIQQIASYALLLLVIGILIDLLQSGKRARYVSMLFMGFGFIFFGMKLIVGVTQTLETNLILQQIFLFLSNRPLVLFIISVAFTVFAQNSAATIGLAIALSFSGLINLDFAIPIVLGANVGTCSGSILASLGSNTAGKRLALAHFLLKFLGAMLAFVFMEPFIHSIVWVCHHLHEDLPTSGQIALAHLLFNLYLVILFLPFVKAAAWLIQKLVPEPREKEVEKFGTRYLDPKSLDVPSLAFANVKREILRMLDLDLEMFRDCPTVFEKSDRVLLEMIHNQDDQVDLLNREIKFYLAKLSQESLDSNQGEMELRLVEMTSTLEEIGDVVNRDVLELAEKKIRLGLNFSEEGWNELKDFHQRILENFQIAAGSLATEDETLAKKLLRHNEQLAQIEKDYRQGHLNRLHQGLKETLETSSIHLDLLSNFYRINFLLGKLIRKAYTKF